VPILLSGEIGGEVTFCCPYNNQKLERFPYQNGRTTRLDHENVHMNHLNISHAGKYTCHFLSITAPYTRPNITMSCSDTGHNCKVTCTSHGGYPKNKFSWDVPPLGNASGPTWGAVENPPECDPKTKLCNISSTASFNCSFGLRRDLHCYVDDNPEIFSAFSVCPFSTLFLSNDTRKVILSAGPLKAHEPLHAPPPPGCWLCCSVLFNQQLNILRNQLEVWTYFQYGLQPLLLTNNSGLLGEMFIRSFDLICADIVM
uniref:Ig-like domain-containing protein n=1 Tax=Sphaeramia orbicularis TaxID=375764 RepID=A0A673BW00_9TELE